MEIHKYIFMAESRVMNRAGQFRKYVVGVEAYDKDHAIKRLKEAHPEIDSGDWDYIDEVGLNHFVGILGEDLSLTPNKTTIAKIIKGLF